jgi:hypothetical protein
MKSKLIAGILMLFCLPGYAINLSNEAFEQRGGKLNDVAGTIDSVANGLNKASLAPEYQVAGYFKTIWPSASKQKHLAGLFLGNYLENGQYYTYVLTFDYADLSALPVFYGANDEVLASGIEAVFSPNGLTEKPPSGVERIFKMKTVKPLSIAPPVIYSQSLPKGSPFTFVGLNGLVMNGVESKVQRVLGGSVVKEVDYKIPGQMVSLPANGLSAWASIEEKLQFEQQETAYIVFGKNVDQTVVLGFIFGLSKDREMYVIGGSKLAQWINKIVPQIPVSIGACSSTDIAAQNLPLWRADETYSQPGHKVQYRNLRWTNNQWTKNQAPDVNKTFPWVLDSDIILNWSADRTYLFKSRVLHKNRLYEAKYEIASGQVEPGANDGWKFMTANAGSCP